MPKWNLHIIHCIYVRIWFCGRIPILCHVKELRGSSWRNVWANTIDSLSGCQSDATVSSLAITSKLQSLFEMCMCWSLSCNMLEMKLYIYIYIYIHIYIWDIKQNTLYDFIVFWTYRKQQIYLCTINKKSNIERKWVFVVAYNVAHAA